MVFSTVVIEMCNQQLHIPELCTPPKTLYPLLVTPNFSQTPVPHQALGNHKFTFCFYKFAYLGHFIKM